MTDHDLHIAVVGLSGEFPGAKTIAEFWRNLISGSESIHQLSQQDLQKNGVSKSLLQKDNYVPRAAVLDDIDRFAAEFFGYSPREAALMDPQQRKLLEHAWHACEDAAINPFLYEGAMGVFVGSSINTYLLNNILSHPNSAESEDIQQILFGNGTDYLATRIAYQLNCRGPAMNIQTACSTSLVAIHEACQHLLTYQVDTALAGGVSISVPQEQGYVYSVDGILSPDGHCKPFSQDAQGTVFSSGLGVVVLKRLADAIADGNPIYALIHGSAINNDGHQKVGYTAPSVDGQAEVIALAQASANINARDIGYIEAHGTGTQLGDPIELTALQQVFAEQTNDQQFCALGSLKSNIGHLDVAAGVAGFIKSILVLQKQQIPKTLHCHQPTSKFDWPNSAFYVNKELEKKDLAYAAVSCFGIGGTNAHIVLGRYQQNPTLRREGKPVLLVFSAKSPKALHRMLEQFLAASHDLSDQSLDAIARTLQQGRVVFRYRTAFVVHSLGEIAPIIRQKCYKVVSCEQEREALSINAAELCDVSALETIAERWLAGHSIDWQAHYALLNPRMLHLPVYPFERERYWIEPYRAEKMLEKTPHVLPIDDWFYQPTWQPRPLAALNAVTPSTVLVLLKKEMAAVIKHTLFAEFGEVIFAYADEEYRMIDSTTFTLNSANKEHYLALLNTLVKENRRPHYIVHVLSLTATEERSTVASFHAQQPFGLISVLHLMHAFEQVCQNEVMNFTVLTNRLNRIAEGASEPHKAPILAAVKVLPKEYRTLQAQLVDVDFIDHPQYSAYQTEQFIQEMVKPHYEEEEIVLRGISRWVRVYAKTPIHSYVEAPFMPGQRRVIVIFGGLGQLGLDISDYFSQYPGIKLALVSRRDMPAYQEWEQLVALYEPNHPTRQIIERLITMRARGCDVQLFKADISNRASVVTLINQIEQQWGAINGVIHAAGETVNGIISMKTEESLLESYQAKVFGSYHLCEVLADKTLDFMILCSSMNAIIGGLGQLDNTAANSFIDYLAEYQAAKTGQPIFSINWGAINMDRPLKVNVVPQFIELSTEHKRNRMGDKETAAVYTRLLTHRFGPRVVISTLDMNDVLLNWNRVASINDLDREIAINTSPHSTLSAEESPRTPMEQWLAETWTKILGITPISREANFFTLGGHSLSAVQFMTKVLEQQQLKVHVMVLYEIPTLHEFASYMERLR